MSKIASTRVSVRCACWPPGPLERENRSSISRRGTDTLRVTRIASPFPVDSRSMAAILLDIDGVFHVSGTPIAGGAEAVRRLRANGHRLRFVTNTTVRTRAALTAELASFGVELSEAELQTTAEAAVRVLAGRRVLALTMPSVVADLEGLDLVGEDADVVLVGGADEGGETGRVFSYMNLARAFAELQAGADLYCLHRNRWWQTLRGPMLDSGMFVAGLEYAAGVDAVVLGKPSPHYFAAALEALGAEPGLAWMVGDDIEADIAGAQRHGMRTALVRTGKFRPDDLERAGVVPDIVVNSLAELPDWLERELAP
jgi:HAD superfamily hydrolase (TIGR01458 family)